MVSLICKNFAATSDQRYVRFTIVIQIDSRPLISVNGFRYDPASHNILTPRVPLKKTSLNIVGISAPIATLLVGAMSHYYDASSHTLRLPEDAQTIEITEERLRSLLQSE